jgi:hypothetical protein
MKFGYAAFVLRGGAELLVAALCSQIPIAFTAEERRT